MILGVTERLRRTVNAWGEIELEDRRLRVAIVTADDDDDDGPTPNQKMTERFRAFAD